MAKRAQAHSDLSDKVDWGASIALDVERMLLGMLLVRGDTWDAVASDIQPRHLYEPLHRRIFELIEASRSKGLAFGRGRLETLLEIDPRFASIGGTKYLDKVEGACTLAEISGHKPEELAKLVRDLYVRREVIAACADIQQAARADGQQTGAELRASLETRLFAADFAGAGDAQLQTLQATMDAAMHQSEHGGAELIATGLVGLDARLAKMERGDLLILGARPSMGKSTLAGCIAMNCARAGVGVIEINGEMSEGQMARRHISDLCHHLGGEKAPTYRDIRKGQLTEAERKLVKVAQEQAAQWPCVMLTKPGISIPALRQLAGRQAREWLAKGVRLGVLVVDHIGIITSGQQFRSELEELSFISKNLKAMAKELGIVVIALSQLSRKVEEREDKRPVLSDLRSSGTIEQDADVVVFVYRERYYAERMAAPEKSEARLKWLAAKQSDEVELICAKVREGAPGTTKVWADVARSAIRDSAPSVPGNDDLFSDKDLKT